MSAALVAVIHDSRARRKPHAKANHNCRTAPVVLFGQHETGRSAREVSVVLQDFIRTLNLGGVRFEMQLRADSVEYLLASRMDETVVYLGQV